MDIDFEQIMDDLKAWFEELPEKINRASNRFVQWCKDLPKNIKYFIDHFPEIMEKAKNDVIAYFKSCDRWEYIAWGGNGAGFICVVIALIFW